MNSIDQLNLNIRRILPWMAPVQTVVTTPTCIARALHYARNATMQGHREPQNRPRLATPYARSSSSERDRPAVLKIER